MTGGGGAGTQVWKWINLSQLTGNAGFTVSAGNLTQTFQIGARENGLDMDKFLFGMATNTFTVAELDAGGPGTPPASIVLPLPPDLVAGNLMQFNDNGNWTWYCDERSVIDKARGNLIVGSDASPPGQTNYRCWNDDVQSYSDGTVQAIIATRINNNVNGNDDSIAPNHAFFFCRYDGTNWNDTYLCQAGTKLYSSEADYVGLGCLSPNDPNTVFISTKYDPRAVQFGVTDTNPPYSNFHEIWKGVTTDHGASFTWTPITQNSTHDNLRPIVPAWDTNNLALLWFRATYNSAQSIDGAPVGLVERHAEVPVKMTYVDANTTNTTLATGAAPVTGTGTGQWHLRTTTGNNGDVLASADVVAEEAPTLETTVLVPGPGTYDMWVNFWGNPLSGSDWRIMAGMTTNQMQVYRQMACKIVQPGDHNSTLVLTNAATNFLYQAYVGRLTASSSNTVSVFVDDNAIALGSMTTLVASANRTWYDGVSYAAVTPLQFGVTNVAYNANAKSVTFAWNSVPPGSSLLPQSFTVQKKNSLGDANWTTAATNLPSAGGTTSFSDNSATNGSAFYRITLP